jgi:hypothetical protein
MRVDEIFACDPTKGSRGGGGGASDVKNQKKKKNTEVVHSQQMIHRS